MEIYTVSFFGHRYIDSFYKIEEKLEEIIRTLIREHEYVDFLVGRDGDFDQIVASTIKRVKRNMCDCNSSLNTLKTGYSILNVLFFMSFFLLQANIYKM